MSNEKDVLQILLATDCHLGYLERDAVRCSDSLATFEEILKIAVETEVDFILLGGDLFHENKPSRKVLNECMTLLRKYCMGDKPIQFRFLSDQSENFKHSACPIVNFEDPNLKVSMPIFSIYGNHDNPVGPGCYCSLDLLSTPGLVNYFGKCIDLENIEISPLIFQKGSTKVCLYGMGSIRDERLHGMFLDGKVKFLKPKETSDDYFNMLVLHQNRTDRGTKNYIPENFLDDFLDLVVWGHEHECRIDPEENKKQHFFVTQPGSSIVTSLRQSETVPKQIGILQIRQKKFQIRKVPLRTVRQFYIRDVDLAKTGLNLREPCSKQKAIDYCKTLVDELIENAEKEHSGHPKQPKLPLIRLRVFCPLYFDVFSVQRFGFAYESKVANSKDIILFKKTGKRKAEIDSELLQRILSDEDYTMDKAFDSVKEYFERVEGDERLLILSEIGFHDIIRECQLKKIKKTIRLLVDHQDKKTRSYLEEKTIDMEFIKEEILKFMDERRKDIQAEMLDFQSVINEASNFINDDSTDTEDTNCNNVTDKTATSIKGRRKRSGTTKKRNGQGRNKRKAKKADLPL